MNSNQSVVEGLRWEKFPVLSDGFITLVDVMGDDAAVVQAARVSYGKDERFVRSQEDAEEATKADRTLIRYLMSHRHTTPFEMCEVKLLIRIPMDAWRQWVRHRTASINEYSTRYTTAIDSRDVTEARDGWRSQSKSNKQGSGDRIDEVTGVHLTSREKELHALAQKVYAERIELGVANEQARKDLPLSTYTEAYWKCDLHNLLKFLILRMDSHAQKEIRDYATILGQQIIKPLFPVVWEAFEDYYLKAMYLSGPEIDAINRGKVTDNLSKREAEDLARKIKLLGLT